MNDAERYARLRGAYLSENHEIEQVLGRALGYPRYADDQASLPGATGDEVCVGEHVPATLAMEAAERITCLGVELQQATAENAELKSIVADAMDRLERNGVVPDVEEDEDSLSLRILMICDQEAWARRERDEAIQREKGLKAEVERLRAELDRPNLLATLAKCEAPGCKRQVKARQAVRGMCPECATAEIERLEVNCRLLGSKLLPDQTAT